MKVHYDEKADALYWRLDDSRIVESREVQEDGYWVAECPSLPGRIRP